ncbi:pseudouridine synthase [Faucicola mancuniensis]|uniref:pseudouridine synthase n=1 Tax=Faucicola mancuniensis TaxID=1309795 RepID=UPI003977B470
MFHQNSLLNGVKPSRIYLPHDKKYLSGTLLDFFCQHFSHIGADEWQNRFDKGLIFNQNNQQLSANMPYLAGQTLCYYRDVGDEPVIAEREKILWVDEHLIVVDKPYFLPVIPTGRFVKQTLLTRLRLNPDVQGFGIDVNVENISPIHRLDKDTAGVMLFSHNPTTRSFYQQLFEKKQVQKMYEAIAKTRQDLIYPYEIRSKLVRGDDFFLTKTVAGEPNAITTIHLVENLTGDLAGFSRYHLYPLTGKKHQLRVHMLSLGMPLLNDNLYPVVAKQGDSDFSKPLKLLAKHIAFTDPISGQARTFYSTLTL